MRHRVARGKLGRTTAHKEAMLRNMVTSLLEYERIVTTLAKAKELRKVADRMITLAKKGDLHAMRQALRIIRKKDVAAKLFKEKAILFNDRQGGYTRILRLGPRPGDNASMAVVELTVRAAVKKEKPATKSEKKSPMQAAREAVSKKAMGKSPVKKSATRVPAKERKAGEGEGKHSKTKKPGGDK